MARQRSPSISTVISERSILIRTIVSIVVIIGVSITWALSTQFSKTAIKTNPDKFSAPYFMMFFSTSFMSMCYPVYMLYEFFSRHNVKVAHVAAQGIFGSKGWTILSWLKTVGPFLFLWICANYSYTRSLMSITPSIATSISATNTAIVYVLSILVLGDRFNIFKILSILFAIAGVVVISVDHSKLSAHFIGIILAIVSATSAAIYKVLFKRQIGSASLGQVSLFMSSLGMLDLCVNWIPPLVLGLTDVEHIEFDYIPWAPMAIGACLSLLFNFLINFGIALLNPLTVSIGMLMGIPLNAAIDVIFRHTPLTFLYLLGTGLIMISFVLIVFPYELVFNKFKKSAKVAQETKENENIEQNSSDNTTKYGTVNHEESAIEKV